MTNPTLAPTSQVTSDEKQWAKDQVEKFGQIHDQYILYEKILKDLLDEGTRSLSPHGIVEARAKTIQSFGEKIWRKRGETTNPVKDFTDLAGARIITSTQDEVKTVSEWIEQTFIIDIQNSVQISQRLKPSEFGYRSVHYIVQLKPGMPGYDELKGLKAEIQVRTMLEHTFADFSHRMSYKRGFALPARLEREFAGLAAQIEQADSHLVRIKTSLSHFDGTYGVYRSKAKVDAEIVTLELLLFLEPTNVDLAIRIAQFQITIGNWEKAIDVLSPFDGDKHDLVRRDLGIALVKQHQGRPRSTEFIRGQKYLEEVREKNDNDAEALIQLASTYNASDPKKGKTYQRAYELDPTNPYILSYYLNYILSVRRDIAVARGLDPVFSRAIRRSQELIEVGLGLPWAYYNIGEFQIFSRDPHGKGLSATAKGIAITDDEWILASRLDAVDSICDGLSQAGTPPEEYLWLQRLLLLAHAVRGKCPESIERLERLATHSLKFAKDKPVLIIAGDGRTDPARQADLVKYEKLLKEGLTELPCTVISGGTDSGVSLLAANLKGYHPSIITLLGYLPEYLPSTISKADSRYDLHIPVAGKDFSPMACLQYWTDIVSAGIDPKTVRLIGIGGGPIAAFEYRIALALGADVGLFPGSGREADRLLVDPEWMSAQRPIPLIPESETIRWFIALPPAPIDPQFRDMLGEKSHENYLKEYPPAQPKPEENQKLWDDLSGEFRESSKQQADAMREKLRLIGYRVQKVKTGDTPTIITLPEGDVEKLARLEHGRYCAERLRVGWRLGPKRIKEKKINPTFIPYDELPDEEKKKDLISAREMPALLASIGYEIHPVSPGTSIETNE